MGGGTLSGGGGGFTGCNIPLDSNFAGDGVTSLATTIDQIAALKVQASTAVIDNMFILNGVRASWRHVDVYLNLNVATRTISGETITYVIGASITTTAPSPDAVPGFGITYLGFGGRPA